MEAGVPESQWMNTVVRQLSIRMGSDLDDEASCCFFAEWFVAGSHGAAPVDQGDR